MLFAVLTHRDVFESVIRDPTHVPAVVQEALRWEPPTALLPRFAPKDIRFADREIPGGSEVLFAVTSANRDASRFERPNVFDPWRSEREFMSFGYGSHFCLGSHLARREMEVSLRVFAERLPTLELVEPEQVGIRGTVLRGPKSLEVRIA